MLLQFNIALVSIFKIKTMCAMKTISVFLAELKSRRTTVAGQMNKKIMRVWAIWQQQRLSVVLDLEVIAQTNHILSISSKGHGDRKFLL